MGKVIKYYYEVEYRTVGGSCHSWEGYAEDDNDAISKALDESFDSWCNDDHFHSTVYISNNEYDTIFEDS